MTIIVRFSPDMDASRELAAIATDIAFSFSDRFADRKSGVHRCVVYVRDGYVWQVRWTRARAVVVVCQRKWEPTGKQLAVEAGR